MRVDCDFFIQLVIL